jgi:uncharacterized protein YyaL (SSP411 family)
MCWNLNYLGNIFQQSTWTTQAQKMISLMRKMILQYPSSFAFWGQSFAHMAMNQKELVGVGPHSRTIENRFQPPFYPLKASF